MLASSNVSTFQFPPQTSILDILMTFNLIIALQPLYYIIIITKQFGADSHFIYLVVELVVVLVVVVVVVNYLLDGVNKTT